VGLFEGIAVDTVGILEGSIDGTTDGVSEADFSTGYGNDV